MFHRCAFAIYSHIKKLHLDRVRTCSLFLFLFNRVPCQFFFGDYGGGCCLIFRNGRVWSWGILNSNVAYNGTANIHSSSYSGKDISLDVASLFNRNATTFSVCLTFFLLLFFHRHFLFCTTHMFIAHIHTYGQTHERENRKVSWNIASISARRSLSENNDALNARIAKHTKW